MTSLAVQIDPCSSSLPPGSDIRREFDPSQDIFGYASCKINLKFEQLRWGGQPLTDVARIRDGLGYYRDYQDSAGNPFTIFYSEKTDAHEIHGAIQLRYKELEVQGLFLGLPTTDERDATGGGKYNDFLLGEDKSSSIYWTAGTGAHEIYGDIWKKWVALGRENSPLRYPMTGELDARDGGRYQDFQEGSIYWKPGIGAYEVHGAIFDKWDEMTRERHLARESGPLGYPITDERNPIPGLYSNRFEKGVIFSSQETGTHPIYGEILNKWGTEGNLVSVPGGTQVEFVGRLGLPTTDEEDFVYKTETSDRFGTRTQNEIGRYQAFKDGAIYWTARTGSIIVSGDIYDVFKSKNMHNGCLGRPLLESKSDSTDVRLLSDQEYNRLPANIRDTIGTYTVSRLYQAFERGMITVFGVYSPDPNLQYLRAPPPIPYPCTTPPPNRIVSDFLSRPMVIPSYEALHNDCVERYVSERSDFQGGNIPGTPVRVEGELCKFACVHANGSEHLEAGIYGGWAPCGIMVGLGG